MPIEIVETEDGSITCLDRVTGELYHNQAGAYAEALENFIKPSCLLEKIKTKKTISILDLPFGLGYNTFVFLQALIDLPPGNPLQEVEIIGLEIDSEVMKLLPRVLADNRFAALRSALSDLQGLLHRLARFEAVRSSIGKVSVLIHCQQSDIRQAVPALVRTESKFDAIFHDPFSPGKMPELWTIDLFSLYRLLLKEDARLLTYSSAVAVRGACREVGLSVYRTAGLGGKSGGTMASVSQLTALQESIFPLTEAELNRLNSRSSVPYRDPNLSSERSQILHRRQKEQSAWQQS